MLSHFHQAIFPAINELFILIYTFITTDERNIEYSKKNLSQRFKIPLTLWPSFLGRGSYVCVTYSSFQFIMRSFCCWWWPFTVGLKLKPFHVSLFHFLLVGTLFTVMCLALNECRLAYGRRNCWKNTTNCPKNKLNFFSLGSANDCVILTI